MREAKVKREPRLFEPLSMRRALQDPVSRGAIISRHMVNQLRKSHAEPTPLDNFLDGYELNFKSVYLVLILGAKRYESPMSRLPRDLLLLVAKMGAILHCADVAEREMKRDKAYVEEEKIMRIA